MLSTSLGFQSTYEMMPPVCKPEPGTLLSAAVLVGPRCRHAGSAARKACTPEGPVIRMGKGNHRTRTQVRFALTNSRDARFKGS